MKCLLLALPLLALACSSPPDDEALDRVEAPIVTREGLCTGVYASCYYRPLTALPRAEWKSFGCVNPFAYQSTYGMPYGKFRGALCDDTPEVREYAKGVAMSFFTEACDACLARPPAGKGYLFVTDRVAPQCTSGCSQPGPW
jgi:hypothetical protein